jgi:hypothetical protein
MRTAGRRLLLALVVFLVPGLVVAQGLGDVAARERQKREAAPHREKPRVLGNDDLARKDPAGASTAAEASGGDAAAEGESSRRKDPDRRGNEDAQGQAQLEQAEAAVDAARNAVVEAEVRAKALGDKLNPMSPSFIYGNTQGGDAVGEEMRTRDELRQAEAQLAEVRDALVKASQAYEDVRQRQRTTPPE